ncbi:unnamed protein product, partial [Didymodactylos carnosus]
MLFNRISVLISNRTFVPNIQATFLERQDLMENIQKTIKLAEKQLITLNLCDQRQKATRDLTTESGSFLIFQLFKSVLLKLPKTPESKQEMIKKCRQYYRGNEKQLEKIKEFDSTYKSNEAIKCYTKYEFIYRLVNKALRTEDINELLIFRFFIIDLCLNLAKKHNELKKIEKQPIIDLYRGVCLS